MEQVAAAGLFPAVEHLQAYSDLLDTLDRNGGSGGGSENEAAVSAFEATNPGWQFNDQTVELEQLKEPLRGGGAGWFAELTLFDESSSRSGDGGSSGGAPPHRLLPMLPAHPPKRKISDVLAQFMGSARVADKGLFFACRHDDIASLSNRLHDVTSTMALTDAFTFCMAPVRASDHLSFSMLSQFAEAWARGKPTALNIRFPPTPPDNVLELSDLCTKHNIVDLYLWLSNRFPGNFVERELALRQKALAIALIQESLATMDLDLEDIANLGFRKKGPGGSGDHRKGKVGQGAMNGHKSKSSYSKPQRPPLPRRGKVAPVGHASKARVARIGV